MTLPLPDWVSLASIASDVLETDAAQPEELAQLSPAAIQKRRDDFSLGRIAARRALLGLGISGLPVLREEGGAPAWPAGVVGAITHTAQQAAAAVAHERNTAGIGLDVERFKTVREDIASIVADEAERAWVAGDQRRLIALFSAKESVYKAFYRFRREFFGFDAVHLRWADQGFAATLLEPMGQHWPAGYEFFIHCQPLETVVWTALWLPPIRSSG